MIKIVKIINIDASSIICQLSDDSIRSLNLTPILAKHSHLNGIEKLKDINYLKKAKIGVFGEITWSKTITSSSGEIWDYDISPEYVDAMGELISDNVNMAS